jgi:dicarboxylate transporter 10
MALLGVLTPALTQSAMAAIRTALKTEGPMFVFKGWVPAWMRLNPTTVLIFMTFEQLKRGVDHYRVNYRDQDS